MKNIKESNTNKSISSNEFKPSKAYSHRIEPNKSVLLCNYETKGKANTKKELNESKVIMHISCINCGCSIVFDEIDNHAAKCIKVTEEVMKNEFDNNVLSSIDYKLRKLKEHLSNINNEIIQIPQVYDKEIKYVCGKLAQCITESLHLEEIDLYSIKHLKKIIKDIDILNSNKALTLSSVMHIDKTRVLVSEKLRSFIKPYRNKSNKRNNSKGSLVSYENNTATSPEIEVNKYVIDKAIRNRRVVSLSNSGLYEYNSEIQMKINNDINQRNTYHNNYKQRDESNNYSSDNHLNTDVDHSQNEIMSIDINKPNGIMSTNTSMSFGSDICKEEHHFIDKENKQIKGKECIDTNMYSEEEKIKSGFFKAVFKIKFEKLHSSHKGQLISHTLLWNECIRLNIPQSKWKAFIFKELNNPTKYSIIQMKTNKKFASQNFVSMPIIDEENMYQSL